MSTANLKPTTDQDGTPSWWNSYARSWLAGEATCYIPWGDLNGYAKLGVAHRAFLLRALAAKRIVIQFDPAAGISFPMDDLNRNRVHRKQALQAIGFGQGGAQPQQSAAAGALAQLRGQSADQAQQADPFDQAKQTAPALALIERLMRADGQAGKVAVILNHGDLLMPQTDKGTMDPASRVVLATLLNWAADETLAKCENPVFLLAPRLSDLHADLRANSNGWKAIEIRLPDRATRLEYITGYLNSRAAEGDPIACEISTDQLANSTAGLSLRNIEDILLMGAQAGAVTAEGVKSRKDEIITAEYSDVATMIDPLPAGFAGVGGMQYLIDFAQDEILAAMREGRRRDVPKGVLLVGPPGTGKTHFMRALAQEARMNAVELQMGKILGGIVGETEQKMDRFFGFVRSLTPCIVFMDEVDQSEAANRGNGSGNPVAANVFSAMLRFLGDETIRGQVLMVFASNRPDLLDPALKRFGRMDAIVPVLLPDREAREGIIRVQAKDQAKEITARAVTTLAERTDDFSAADLAAIVSKARKLANREGAKAIDAAHIDRALKLIRPSTVKDAAGMTLLAIEACNDAEYLPPEYAAKLADRDALAAEIEAKAADLPGRRGRREL